MKELDRKDVPEVSGGETTPEPIATGDLVVPLPGPTPTYPQSPVYDPLHKPGHLEQ